MAEIRGWRGMLCFPQVATKTHIKLAEVVDPITKRVSAYTELGLQNVSSFSLAEYSFQLTPSELFSDL